MSSLHSAMRVDFVKRKIYEKDIHKCVSTYKSVRAWSVRALNECVNA